MITGGSVTGSGLIRWFLLFLFLLVKRPPVTFTFLLVLFYLLFLLVEQFEADTAATGLDGQTGLHRVADRGREKALQVLLTLGAEINARDAKGRTPLQLASAKAKGVKPLGKVSKKRIYLGLCPKHRTPPTHRARLGQSRKKKRFFYNLWGLKAS